MKDITTVNWKEAQEDVKDILVKSYFFFQKYIKPLKKPEENTFGLEVSTLRCAKCGRADVSTRYCYESGDAINCTTDHDGEILHHVCKVCGYKWNSPTVDSKR